MSSSFKKSKNKENIKSGAYIIGKPMNFVHNIHVTKNIETGILEGLPKSWCEILGIPYTEVTKPEISIATLTIACPEINSDDTENILHCGKPYEQIDYSYDPKRSQRRKSSVQSQLTSYSSVGSSNSSIDQFTDCKE